MEQIIHIRQTIIGFYKKFEVIINYVLKFLVGLFIFSRINTLGMFREEFAVLFDSAAEVAYLALVSLLFTISPPAVALFLVAVAVTIQISAATEVAVFVFLLMVLLIIFYARLSPRRSMLMLAIIFGFYFHMPYAVVLFAGLFFGISSIIPIVLGTAVWYFLPFFTDLALSMAHATDILTEIDLFELPIAFMEVFAQIYSHLTTDFNWVVLGFVFAMMILAVHLISLISLNYAKDIAIAVGAVIGMVCMTMVVFVTDLYMSVPVIFISAFFSALIVWIIKFFDNVADYKRVERVTFDDDDNIYYVKIVPKIAAEKADAPEKARPKKPSSKHATRHLTPPASPARGPAYRSSMYETEFLDEDDA
ncbi:MAG: hypothetical protein LBE55_00110 [Clostridiales bacterium]|jgi:hypothetical protein|nr:hypothetical protein [Clostridiales bacterium]